jgi:hypothetical protein
LGVHITLLRFVSLWPPKTDTADVTVRTRASATTKLSAALRDRRASLQARSAWRLAYPSADQQRARRVDGKTATQRARFL